MKKLITTLSLFALLLLPAISYAQPSSYDDFCAQPTGQFHAQIQQFKADGFQLVEMRCAPVLYLVPPTPPYLNATVFVTLFKVECPPFGQLGPCVLKTEAHFHADEIVINSAGTKQYDNISRITIIEH
ncbi:MAG: hypothetical protein ACI837_000855 [Crocinitomicaceae bacterium]|jgi:hypothetical protein